MNKQGKIILISGPSGVGKKTIIDLLKTNENLNLSYSISYTTREKRKTEINGKDYFFISVEEFKQKIKNGDFLEYAVFCNNYYGTDKNQVISMINNGFNVILEIEVQGAKNVLNIIPKNSIISIFILPPNIEELVKRLMQRNTENIDEIKNRISKAESEINEKTMYQYNIINDNVNEVVNKIAKIIKNDQ